MCHPYVIIPTLQMRVIKVRTSHLEVINVSFLCHHPYGVTPMLQGTVLKVRLKGRV